MRGVFWVRKSVLGLSLGVSAGSSGCYTYAVASRQGPPNNTQQPIDRQNPQTSVQWSYAWGLSPEFVWSPIVCNNGEEDASGHCLKGASDPCHGQGIGFYETKVPWYGVLTNIFTLGFFLPVRLTYYCSTAPPASAVGTGPQ